ncbi:MAG: helix-turn-helix domain-containing protein [Rhodospirillales bacterium]|nr:helix-turn-helix domain-containing protein [Rhodospirillales bacterium]
MQIEPLAYTVAQAVAVSGQSRTSLYAAFKSGALIARKRGFRSVILADDLRAWLENLPRLETRPAA